MGPRPRPADRRRLPGAACRLPAARAGRLPGTRGGGRPADRGRRGAGVEGESHHRGGATGAAAMMGRRWLWLLAIALVAAGRLFAVDAAGAAEPTISISGAVVNGTTGGAAPTDAPVSVIGIRGRRAFEQTRSTAGPGGRFEVTDLPSAPGLTYIVRVDHGGVPYWSNPVQSSDGPARELTVEVFERTDDIAAIDVERHSLVVLEPSAGQRTLQMRETVVLRN